MEMKRTFVSMSDFLENSFKSYTFMALRKTENNFGRKNSEKIVSLKPGCLSTKTRGKGNPSHKYVYLARARKD